MRFIPAGAGNTTLATKLKPSSPVYPRWRGEHALPHASRSSTGGLSPLARGTQKIITDE
ncbi:hypothetical protein AW67_34310 [Salmonella enterica subsp. enterica serovar Montevideo str. USDA-ARS-USMARC-1903]|nr:hypothetical protein AW67_34310 [Salmonella enterica subsp. enterica serovar Montevideo str. USDA-ARS-USMARC-1903]